MSDARLPCPVCLGATMENTLIGSALALDHCRRCGGVWFDGGEVGRLRSLPATDLWKRVAVVPERSRVPCHSCLTPMHRSADACAACGWRNRIDCPTCERTMERERRGTGLFIDRCKGCEGVWLDHAELSMVWSAAFAAVLPAVPVASERWIAHIPDDGGLTAGLLRGSADMLSGASYSGGSGAVDLLGGGAELLGHAASATVHAVASVPELALAVAELAAHAFKLVLEIICGLLEGL